MLAAIKGRFIDSEPALSFRIELNHPPKMSGVTTMRAHRFIPNIRLPATTEEKA